MFRRVAELVSRPIILTRRLPEEFGGQLLYVTPDASLKLWRRDLSKVDPWLLGMARDLARPGDTVWDIGANVGLFAFACAGLGASVVAVEPDEKLCALLRRSQAANGAKVVVVPFAISDKEGATIFHIARRGRASNHLGKPVSTQTGGAREMLTVNTVTLDALLDSYPAPGVLKIDVEGAEADALRAAAKVLAHRPRVLIEVADCHTEEVTQILKDHQYELFNAETREPVERAVWNTLALPLWK